ncbi:MAG: Transcriptional regulator, AcrR family, partial [uncultured Rubellimicrobium sp.]
VARRRLSGAGRGWRGGRPDPASGAAAEDLAHQLLLVLQGSGGASGRLGRPLGPQQHGCAGRGGAGLCRHRVRGDVERDRLLPRPLSFRRPVRVRRPKLGPSVARGDRARQCGRSGQDRRAHRDAGALGAPCTRRRGAGAHRLSRADRLHLHAGGGNLGRADAAHPDLCGDLHRTEARAAR